MSYKNILLTLFVIGSIFIELIPTGRKTQQGSLVYIGNYNEIIDVQFGKEFIYIQSGSGLFRISNEGFETGGIKKRSNFVFSIFDDSLIFCEWENRSIYKKDDFATQFKIVNENGKVDRILNFNETVKPITCNGDDTIFIDNYPNSPERTYIIKSDGGLHEVELEPRETQTRDSPGIFPEHLELIKYPIEKTYTGDDSVVGIDSDKNVWLYKNLRSEP